MLREENAMLIYLVRWPDLSASFVQAESEEHLLDILDQVGNPDDCEYEGGESTGREEALPEAELRKALHAELERFFKGSWRRAQLGKKTDAISKLAHDMDLPVKLARKYEEMAREQQGNERADPKPPKEKQAVESPLLRVSNHHTDNCGPTPSVDGDEAGKYFAYFANQYGEQAVFVYDYPTDEASVWMGETGWHDAHRVVDGRVEGVILNESEAAWIRACWLAAAKRD